MRTARYGRWASPITAADVAASQGLAEYVGFAGEEIWWVESRPAEHGRRALVRRTRQGTVCDVLGPEWDVGTRVIEYGGRPWLWLGWGGVDLKGAVAPVSPGGFSDMSGWGDSGGSGVPEGWGGCFVFTHSEDQRVYRAALGDVPVAISPVPEVAGGERYADFCLAGQELWCLRESVSGAGTEVRRDIVALPVDGTAADDPGQVRVVGHSHHFMTGPKVSPDGRHVVWLGWDHPDMPWDRTDLMCASVTAEGLGPAARIAGGDGIAVGQVEWAPDRPDTLYLLSDSSGWWNVHELRLDGTSRALCPRAEEFGEALWRIGARWFVPGGGGRLFVVHGTCGRQLAVLEADGSLRDIGEPYTEWGSLATDGRRIAATAASPRHPSSVVLVEPDEPRIEVVRAARVAHPAYLPVGRHRRFRDPGGEEVHAYVYPPHNPEFNAPDGELPPFLVNVHGGPTSRSQLVANEEIAYFTSRGFGVIDVQYGGSTGFGRAYRRRLHGHWGVVDVRDCATAIRGLIAEGVADGNRVGIRGGSAGGWTATASLAAEPGLYRVAGIYFPVLDPVAWRAGGTHDFESRYLESLIGPWPQAKQRYEEVSPLRRAGGIRAPILLMQGLDDTICPPAQAELLLAELRGRGLPHTYLTFAGERHGFGRADTISTCLRAELSLYMEVFGL